MRRDAAIWILLALGSAFAVVAFARPDLLSGQRGLWALYGLLVLAYVGSSAWVALRLKPGASLRYIVIWLAIAVALAMGYRLWQAFIA
jgi:hypothetical protein